MNRTLLFLFILSSITIWGCDTADNVPARNENFFIKFYAGKTAGNQEGADVIETSDGGLLIVGTSFSDNHSELLLIKTDSKGNEEWTFGADTTLQFQASVGKSILELADGYLVGGTVDTDLNIRSMLLKISFDGTFSGDSTYIITQRAGTEENNTLSKITRGHSGILVSGETRLSTSGTGGIEGINGFISLHDPITLQRVTVPGGLDIQYFGSDEEDRVTGAYEVLDTINNIGSSETRFLVFGSTKEGNSDFSFYYSGIQKNFGIDPSVGAGKDSLSVGDQFANYVTRYNDTYFMIGQSGTLNPRVYMMGWAFSPAGTNSNNWRQIFRNGEVDGTADVIGKGVAAQSDNKYIVVGDKIESLDVNTLIYLAGISPSLNVETPWPKKFGTNSSTYSASAVTILQDGSIVLVGTADLVPIQKIIIIKTGPNGQMSF